MDVFDLFMDFIQKPRDEVSCIEHDCWLPCWQCESPEEL